MLVSMDKAYKTRGGYPVKIYAVYKDQLYGVLGAVFKNDEWMPVSWKLNGSYAVIREYNLDLVEIAPRIKRTYWVNLYPDKHTATMYEDMKTAYLFEMRDYHKRIACVKVEIDCEEGEGL